MNGIRVIGFDADDTLWVNEPYFKEAEAQLCRLLANDAYTEEQAAKELFATEMQNIGMYGYGIKSFTLSMVETALRLHTPCSDSTISAIVELGKSILAKPVELLDGVEETLQHLQGRYRLVVATKGDLLDQQRKLEKSGLRPYFHHIEIMSDKTPDDYKSLLTRIGIEPHELLMVGNSLKSDVLPVVKLGGKAAHVPYHTTWEHEVVEPMLAENEKAYHTLKHIFDVVRMLG